MVLALGGCVSVERKYLEKHYFVIDVSRQGAPSARHNGAILRVQKLRISPRYEGKGLVYRRQDVSYESDFYNEFFVSPGALLTEEVQQWLARSGLFQHVVASTSQLQASYILEGLVSALYGDYREGTAPKAVLGIQFFLVRDVAARSEIVFQKEYRKEIATGQRSPKTLVEGWNQALREILASFEEDLKGIDVEQGA